jgi:Tfp pilus assembly protein PilF
MAEAVPSISGRPAQTHVRWQLSVILLVLALCAVWPYANTVFNAFVHDDTFQILRNPYLRDASHLRQILTSPVWSFLGPHQSNYYRPMMTLGYLVCFQLFGPSPLAFHLFNLLLHAGIVCLLFAVTDRIFLDRASAFAASAVFAFHPIHTESVAWIAAVTELELAFFYLLTFWFFLDLERPGSKWSPWRPVFMALSFALALLSKEQAVTLPLLATIYEHFYRADRLQTTRTQKLFRYGPLWLLALAYIPLRTNFVGGFAPQLKFPDMTLYQLMLSACALTGQYLGKLLWPAQLHAFYLFHKSTSFFDVGVLLGVLGCCISLAVFFILWKHSRGASFGIVWFFVTLAPVLNAQWLGTNAFTERYTYLPSVGFSWVAGVGVQVLFVRASRAHRPIWRTACIAGIALIATLCTVRIVTRNRDWRNNLVFYSQALNGAPNVPATHELRLNLGVEYLWNGNVAAAEQQFRTILEADPNSINALSNLAAVFLNSGRPVAALEIYLQLIKLQPGNGAHHMNLGVDYMHLDMLDKAESELKTAAELSPNSANTQDSLGLLYWRKGDRIQAERTLRHALALDPTNSDAHINLARLYVAIDREDEAIHEYQATLQIDPTSLAARDALRILSHGR